VASTIREAIDELAASCVAESSVEAMKRIWRRSLETGKGRISMTGSTKAQSSGTMPDPSEMTEDLGDRDPREEIDELGSRDPREMTEPLEDEANGSANARSSRR
jgi:hypothetical protein